MRHPEDPTVPRPCPVPTSAMEPREKGDHCRECDTLVLDSARHTRGEFLAILRAGGKVCAQLRPDGAGRVLFADSPLKRRLSVVALSAAMAACGDDADDRSPEVVGITVVDEDPSPVVIGEVATERPPAPPPPVMVPLPPGPPPGEPPSDETGPATPDDLRTVVGRADRPLRDRDHDGTDVLPPGVRGRVASPDDGEF